MMRGVYERAFVKSRSDCIGRCDIHVHPVYSMRMYLDIRTCVRKYFRFDILEYNFKISDDNIYERAFVKTI
jgi:hypothetical protein